ncbi:MAG: type IV pilin protein [Gammaproteobacteria bacterium]
MQAIAVTPVRTTNPVSHHALRRTHASAAHAGFSLIELMVVIAIVALLAAVGVPAYTSQINKAYRADAQSALMQLASAMERYRTINNTYNGTADGSGVPVSTFFPDQAPLDSSQKYYTLRITITNSGNGYTVTAAPISGTRMDGDWSFTLASTGLKQRVSGGSTVTGWDI